MFATLFTFIPHTLAAVDPKSVNLFPDITGNTGSGLDKLQNLSVPGIIGGLITLALIVAAVIFFFMLVIGGIRWILSGGDKGQTEAARSQITAALIGLVIVFSAWAIAQVLATFFDIEILKNLKLPTVERTATSQDTTTTTRSNAN